MAKINEHYHKLPGSYLFSDKMEQNTAYLKSL